MNMINLETREDIWNALRPYSPSWIPLDFLRQLIWAKDNGHIKHVEIIGSGGKNYDWKGEIRIKLEDEATTMFVINRFVMPSHADEVFMPDKNTLRLWWD